MSQMSHDVSTVFRHNGCEYEFDFRDADCAALYEQSIEKLSIAEKNAPKDGKASEMIKYHCDMLKDFFDNVLGKGAGTAICTEKSNVNVCYEAYYAFLEFVRGQNRSIIEFKNSFRDFSNREQRRHPNNSGHHGKPRKP